MTTSDKPAPGHPAPWRWERESDYVVGPGHALFAAGKRIKGGWGLLDAAGNRLVDKEMVFHLDGKTGLRELLRAAPEMEALLRRAMFETQPNGVCGDIHETDDWRQRGLALLDSIDAARKAGG